MDDRDWGSDRHVCSHLILARLRWEYQQQKGESIYPLDLVGKVSALELNTLDVQNVLILRWPLWQNTWHMGVRQYHDEPRQAIHTISTLLERGASPGIEGASFRVVIMEIRDLWDLEGESVESIEITYGLDLHFRWHVIAKALHDYETIMTDSDRQSSFYFRLGWVIHHIAPGDSLTERIQWTMNQDLWALVHNHFAKMDLRHSSL